MKVLTVIYDDKTEYITKIVDNIQEKILIEKLTLEDYKQRKKAIPIMTRHGTTNVPLIVLSDENLDEYAAIWSEENPDLEKKIIEKLSEDVELLILLTKSNFKISLMVPKRELRFFVIPIFKQLELLKIIML